MPNRYADESGYDAALAEISNEEKLHFFNLAVAGLETDEIKLSGIFSCGANIVAQINTRSEHTQYLQNLRRPGDGGPVARHAQMGSERRAVRPEGRRPGSRRSATASWPSWWSTTSTTTPQQIPLGRYDIVFGPAATANLVDLMNFIGFNGGLMKRGFSFLKEENVGQKMFSGKVTLIDDPNRIETYPFKRDFTGIPRQPFPIFQDGVFQGFTWSQDDADEFGAHPTGHTVSHKCLLLCGGEKEVSSLEELVGLPRDRDLLYIPFLHYMNIVNPSKGIITGSSRFGALLLKQDGSVIVPYNVRITQSLLDIFGDKVAWLSRTTRVYNTSHSYGARNPTAVLVPLFMRVNDLEISHSNSSY